VPFAHHSRTRDKHLDSQFPKRQLRENNQARALAMAVLPKMVEMTLKRLKNRLQLVLGLLLHYHRSTGSSTLEFLNLGDIHVGMSNVFNTPTGNFRA
jgi:hypothetical protein